MRNALQDLKEQRSQGQHPGLLLQCYLFENVTGENGNPAEKRQLLSAAIDAVANNEVLSLYRIAFNRWDSSLPLDGGGASKKVLSSKKDLRTSGRLIIGLGSESVLETGLRLHHTYGMPILPGSALKGLAAHYCSRVWGAKEDKFKSGGAYHHLLFGTTDECGSIVFHDAWFVPDSESHPLVLDVMTPHHTKWNDLSQPAAPTDFDSPTPIQFISVVGQFRIVLSWHGPTIDEAQNWLQLTLSLLCDALEVWGIGGKTTSGYGRLVEGISTDSRKFVEPPKAKDRVQATLLEEKTKKGGWKALHEPSQLSGPIQNTSDVPDDKKPHDVLELFVASANQREIAFRYPTSEDKKPAKSPKSHSKSRPKRKKQ